MKIHSLYYKHLWLGDELELEEVHFSDLNVLVGISGAGKTQIVNVINSLAEIANGKVILDITWKICFSIENDQYQWEGQTAFHPSMFENGEEKISEKLSVNGKEIASQLNGIINYEGKDLPKLGESESLIKLLSEPEIEAARIGFQSIIYKNYRNYQETTISYHSIEKQSARYNDLSDIKNSKLPLIAKWYIVTRKFPEIHEKIKQDYIEIFPQVQDAWVRTPLGGDMLEVYIEINSENISIIISQSDISSGMFRALMMIVELYLCHEESLFLMDEFENSLGFNCLDKMFELIENKAYNQENQFILTTHNPYIIRNADLSAIKIVTRKGNKIIVKNAMDLGLADSVQDNFFKIINLKEFREGVSA